MRILHALLPALVLLLAGPALAQDTPYKFRGIALGDSLAKVENTLPQKFDIAKATEAPTRDTRIAKAGDVEGTGQNACPIAAKPDRRPDCLRTLVVLREIDGAFQVLQITVDQSFVMPVALPAFLERMTSAYGKPDAVYTTGQDNNFNGFKERTYAWGGARLPAKDFSISWAPYEDDQRIGGQYIALRVLLNGDAVVGYALRISDAEKGVFLNRKAEAEIKAKASRSGTPAPNNLKF